MLGMGRHVGSETSKGMFVCIYVWSQRIDKCHSAITNINALSAIASPSAVQSKETIGVYVECSEDRRLFGMWWVFFGENYCLHCI